MDFSWPSFFYVRHGQTDANLQHLLCGLKWDISLNEEGKRQAAMAAEHLRPYAEQIKTVCYSPLRRTTETKDIVAEALSPSTTFVPLSMLFEWDLGDWDGQHDSVVGAGSFHSSNPPGGEPCDVFHERVISSLRHCLTTYPGPILFVGHGAFGGYIIRHFQSQNSWLNNGAAYRFVLDEDPRRVEPLAPGSQPMVLG